MRPLRILLATGVAVVALAAPAAAHVSVEPTEADRGSDVTLRFRVPNERDDAATVELAVELPAEFERVEAPGVPGWTASVEGAVVRWSGGRIEPGDTQVFTVSLGPMPADDRLVFKAVQTYDSGEVVRWIDDGHDADHPAPVVTLTGTAPSETSVPSTAPDVPTTVDEDESGGGFPVGGIVVGVVVVLVIAALVVQARRRRA